MGGGEAHRVQRRRRMGGARTEPTWPRLPKNALGWSGLGVATPIRRGQRVLGVITLTQDAAGQGDQATLLESVLWVLLTRLTCNAAMFVGLFFQDTYDSIVRGTAGGGGMGCII